MPNFFGFRPGRHYNRRKDIHDLFGGQEQGGIITPKSHPLIFLITGDRGLEFGYKDRYRADGIMEYYGEGQRGDMSFVRGNRAIRDHQVDGKSLLLFENTGPDLRYLGSMRYTGHRIENAPDIEGSIRKVIVFLLKRDVN
ncbi:MAG TPA: hypothetical protein GXX24_12430 [Paracoccus solventivorans]|uniref:ScoMcrA-like SRA domain-containing protein n=1 Tax=Paracoccus solventivorans TaxID=53463 RepID=A0A832PP38_9RHOB|nr:hypothetical protein [Paracoccus solventivorans]HHW34927.1 hypothetical protein [Paracoccus solventivorans]